MRFDNISFLAYNKFNDNLQQGNFIFASITSIGLSMPKPHVFAFQEIIAPVPLNDGIYVALIL